MAINVVVIVQYITIGLSLPDKLLLTQAPIFVWFDDNTNAYVLLFLVALHGD